MALEPELLEPTGEEVAVEALGALESRMGTDPGIREVFARLVRQVVPKIVTAPNRIQRGWHACLLGAATGRTEEAHAFRPLLGRLTIKALWALKEAHRLASLVAVYTGEEVAGAGDLPSLIAELEKLKTNVLDRWETVEDLQRLVVEQYPLRNARLTELARTRRPPQSWHDEPPPDDLF